MIRTHLKRWLASMALIMISLPTLAAAEPTNPHVVLVGINQYADAQILPRENAERDAQALYDLLTDSKYLGVGKENIRLLLGSEDKERSSRPATRANILAALEWVQSSTGSNDLVILGFFGQGAPLGTRACYFATDSTFKNRSKDAIASGDIQQVLDKIKTEHVCTLLDVNFLGIKIDKKKAPAPNLAKFYTEFLGKKDRKGNFPGRVLFLANNGLAPSLNLGKTGMFAHVMTQGLKGKADTAGYEPDGVVTVDELVKYVRDELPELARTHGKTKKEKSQRPAVLRGQGSSFVLSHNPVAYAASQKRLKSFEQLARKKELSKKELEEGQDLLSRMPTLAAKQSMRKAYQSFVDGKLTVAAFRTARKEIHAAMRISEREAGNYAITVLRAVRVVRQSYVKKTEPGELVDHAIRGLYRRLGEKIPSGISERLSDVRTMKDIGLLKLLSDARRHLGKREDLAKGKDITYSLHPMLSNLDKHTDYIDPETVDRMTRDIRGHFFGIGVQIRLNAIRNQLEVVTPLRGSPAYKAKILTGDIITTIIRDVDNDGTPFKKPEIIPTKGMTTSEAVKKIIGKEGTPVKLIIERKGEKEPLTFTLLRGRVEIETVLGHKRNKKDDSWNYVIDPANGICYLRLTQFSNNSFRDLNKVMKELSKVGIKGFILDLRFNPGGLLDSAVKISDLFIDDGLIVTVRPRTGPETSYIGKSDGSYIEFPMVCLVNGASASASEIVSACLQDHHRALVIGSRSYGKGSVQTIHPFATGGRLKLTTATFWRPSNRNLNRASTKGRPQDEWGVIPDKGYRTKLSTRELDALRDFQRSREIIHRPGTSPPKSDFTDQQLESALDYLRSQIRTAGTGKGNKAG